MPINKIVPGTTNAADAANTINSMVDISNAAETANGFVYVDSLGNAAGLNVGNTAGTVASGNHIHTLSGDITGNGSSTITVTIGSNVVTNAKLATMAPWSFKGRNAATAGDTQDVTFDQLTELTFPAPENYFFGFNLTGQLRKLQIKQLPVQDTVLAMFNARISANAKIAIEAIEPPAADFADLEEATAAYNALLAALKTP